MAKNLLKFNSVTGELISSTQIDPLLYVPTDYTGVVQYLADATISFPSVTVTTPASTIIEPGLPTNGGVIPASSRSVSITPTAEQKLTGTAYGTFTPNELVFQSTITPQIVNYLSLSGATATAYEPTIGRIGVTTGTPVGALAAQFKGSYLDTDTAAAGLSLPAFSTAAAAYFMISGFLLFEATPSGAYDPIIMTRSLNGVSGSTYDSFRMEYDASSGQVQFHFSPSSYASAGYQYITNMSPAGGLTLNQWHHFGVAYTNAGSSAMVSTYWNGTRTAQQSAFTGNLRSVPTKSLMIGCGSEGRRPLKGWLDEIMISGGNTLSALRGLLHGTTAPVPTYHQDAGQYTYAYLSMDGPIGTSRFPCDSGAKIVSVAAYQNASEGSLYVSSVNRTVDANTAIASITLFDGVCGGHTPYTGITAATVFGYDSGACFVPTAVTQIADLTTLKAVKTDMSNYSYYHLLGATAMWGYTGSGNAGDFPKFFAVTAGGFTGATLSFLPVNENVLYMRNAYERITVCGFTGSTQFIDSAGNAYILGTTLAKAVYTDIIAYIASAKNQNSLLNANIAGATTNTALKALTGYGGTAGIKLAKLSVTQPLLQVSVQRKSTGAAVTPESFYQGTGSSNPTLGTDDPSMSLSIEY